MATASFDVRKLPIASPSTIAALKASIGLTAALAAARPAAAPMALQPTKPGKERWTVKTGVDQDVFGVKAEIVPSTIEELSRIPRPKGMKDVTKSAAAFSRRRAGATERTIWQIDCAIVAIKLEEDGDYHLVLQGASGEFMIGEAPTPGPPFVADTSRFKADIQRVRAAIDKRFFKKLKPEMFAPMGKYQMPLSAFSTAPTITGPAPAAPGTGTLGSLAFKSQVKPTKVRLTGVGFFDRVHGQSGVAPNGIELHPVLDIKFL